MAYIPYCNAPITYSADYRKGVKRQAPIHTPVRTSTHPPMLEFLQNPRGLLALNLARTAYWQARLDGVPPHEALEFADAELRAVSGDPDDGLAEWCAAGNEPPAELIRRRDAANDDDEPRREVA